jgi:hypothetical protein
MSEQDFDLENYKAEMARARDLGFSYAVIRHIILQANSDFEDGISMGRAVELIREIGLQAADKAVAEERALVVAYLRTVAPNAPTRRGADELAWCSDAIERGEHCPKETTS